MDLCKDEETILKILASVDIGKMRIDGTDTQGKNILHNYAKKNFKNAIGFLIKRLPQTETKEMIFQQSRSNKSNVFMTCAIHGSGKRLELLLNFVLLFDFLKVDNSFIDMDTILHHKNDYGNTLLSFILQSKDDLLGPKITLLGMEKEFHSRDGNVDRLMCCFHNNLETSGEVLKSKILKRPKKKALLLLSAYGSKASSRLSSFQLGSCHWMFCLMFFQSESIPTWTRSASQLCGMHATQPQMEHRLAQVVDQTRQS